MKNTENSGLWRCVGGLLLVAAPVLCLCAGSCEKGGASGEEGIEALAGPPGQPAEGPIAADAPPEAAPKTDSSQEGTKETWKRPRSAERRAERRDMVGVIRRRYGFTVPNVLEALLKVPRHWFVTPEYQHAAYADTPLPIGYSQTISQPYIAAYMTSELKLTTKSKVLEIGTGSGYQAAVLNELTPHVYTIEIVKPLARRTRDILTKRGYGSIKTKIGDGYKGWAEHAPFDAIIVTCAPEDVPPPLIEQLKPGGRMIIPVGGAAWTQELVLLTKDSQGTVSRENLMPVRFVPLTREKDKE